MTVYDSYVLPTLYGILYAIPPAIGLWVVADFLSGLPNVGGMFAGHWKASYNGVDGNHFTEDIFLKSRFSRVKGYSDCTWTEKKTGQPMKVRYKITGLQRGIQLVGAYIPAVPSEHDMGVFIVRLLPNPSKGVGIITNYKTDTGDEPDWHDLKICDYEWKRPRKRSREKSRE